jgi:hypothetical protein
MNGIGGIGGDQYSVGHDLVVAGPERISVLRRGPGFGTMLHWIEEHE